MVDQVNTPGKEQRCYYGTFYVLPKRRRKIQCLIVYVYSKQFLICQDIYILSMLRLMWWSYGSPIDCRVNINWLTKHNFVSVGNNIWYLELFVCLNIINGTWKEICIVIFANLYLSYFNFNDHCTNDLSFRNWPYVRCLLRSLFYSIDLTSTDLTSTNPDVSGRQRSGPVVVG